MYLLPETKESPWLSLSQRWHLRWSSVAVWSNSGTHRYAGTYAFSQPPAWLSAHYGRSKTTVSPVYELFVLFCSVSSVALGRSLMSILCKQYSSQSLSCRVKLKWLINTCYRNSRAHCRCTKWNVKVNCRESGYPFSTSCPFPLTRDSWRVPDFLTRSLAAFYQGRWGSFPARCQPHHKKEEREEDEREGGMERGH